MLVAGQAKIFGQSLSMKTAVVPLIIPLILQVFLCKVLSLFIATNFSPDLKPHNTISSPSNSSDKVSSVFFCFTDV